MGLLVWLRKGYERVTRPTRNELACLSVRTKAVYFDAGLSPIGAYEDLHLVNRAGNHLLLMAGTRILRFRRLNHNPHLELSISSSLSAADSDSSLSLAIWPPCFAYFPGFRSSSHARPFAGNRSGFCYFDLGLEPCGMRRCGTVTLSRQEPRPPD
jgi:hypothetical protein